MKTPRYLLSLLLLLLMQLCLTAQVQWYQNQDGDNLPPSGTSGTSIQSISYSSFIACYQWATQNDQVTWKISKSSINGTEQKTFFITGTTASVQMKKGFRNTIYLLASDFPLGQNAQYTLYKLDTNLNIKSQRTIDFPNNFSIFNMNAFEIDGGDNIYLAGDGQYPDEFGLGFFPASFVVKTDRDLQTKWTKVDSTQTSYSRLNIDSKGNVYVVENFYSFFPDIHVTKYKSTGEVIKKFTVETDPGRYNLNTVLDDHNDLIIYGGKFTNDGQALYYIKVSEHNYKAIFRKTLFNSIATQLYDWKMDTNGDIYCLVSQYFSENNQVSRISKISSCTGSISWSRTFRFSEDSCNLFKIVMNDNDRFYLVGEKKFHNLLSKGFAMRMKKNSQPDGIFPAPDSVCFQRSHWLTDGIIDRNRQLISIGNTNDLDTVTFQSTYFRAFAVKFGANPVAATNHNNNNNTCNNLTSSGQSHSMMSMESSSTEAITVSSKPVIYPNPVQSTLTVANLGNTYDRLAVYSLQGTMIKEQSVNSATIRVDVHTLPGGVYMLVLRSSATQEKATMRFIIQK